ncbi:MAG: HDOD domain-containing protein [Phycisphaerales bacterium]|nr:HDOD domain-containing protein [Phycisphaerales bacterium]
MDTNTQNRDQLVSSAIREISHIATLPEVTLKIIELVEDPKSTATDLHKVIAGDPALSSRILKVVNSSFYGLPGQIASINRAIVLLGLNAVKNIAIAASLAKLFRGGDVTARFSAKSLWDHSNACAATCKIITDVLKIGLSDEAFLAGLMHDIGVMVEMQYDRQKLIQVVESIGVNSQGVPLIDMLEAEEQAFGANHQHFGSALCEKWKFPRCLSLVTGHHHNPLGADPAANTLPCVVYLADRIVGTAGNSPYRMDLISTEIERGVLDVLKLTDEQVQNIRKRFEESAKDVSSLLAA